MAMIGFVQLLQDQWDSLPEDKRAEYLGLVERQGQRLVEMISKLPGDLPPLEMGDGA